jgi:starch phosphorylase
MTMPQGFTSNFVKIALLFVVNALPVGLPQPAIAVPSPELAEFQLPIKANGKTTVRIDGDSSMSVINQLLKEQYQQQFPDTQVEIDAQGTELALQKLLKDEIDLAAIGRPLTAAEKAKGLLEIPLSQERIAVIIGRENPFKGNLTVDQFVRIVRGEITDWSEVGGAPGAIRFIDRPVDSDTRVALSRYGIFQDREFTTGATAVQLEQDDTAGVIRALGRDGISYAIASQLVSQDKARIVKLVVMHETLPDDPLYPYAQPRGYAYKKSSDAAASSFLGLATTAEPGQATISAAKVAEAQAIGEALQPAPRIAIARTPESETSPFSLTLKAIPLWLRLVLPLGLLGLILQWVLKRLERPAPMQRPVGERTSSAGAVREAAQPVADNVQGRDQPATISAKIVEESADEPIPATDAAAPPTITSAAEPAIPSVTEAGVGSAAAIDGLGAVARPGNYWLDFQQVYERGIGLVANGEYSAALGCFNRVIELNPDFADAWAAKGNVLISLGQSEQAKVSLERANQLKPDDETILRSLAGLIEQGGGVVEPVPEPAQAEQEGEAGESAPATPTASPIPDIPPPTFPAPISVSTPEPQGEPSAAQPLSAVSTIASVIPVSDGRTGYTPEAFKQAFCDNLLRFQGKSLEQATPQDYYRVLAYMVRDRLLQFNTPETYLSRPEVRWLGELSAEYMPGPHLMNNLINLGIADAVRQGLQELGQTLELISEQEEEPGLGKGGLGRLMVCYLDSLSTQEIPAIGYGIRYEYGIFDQEIRDGWQVEVPDRWLQSGNPWEIEHPEGMQEVKFGGYTEAYLDEQGRYQVRWIPQEVIKGFPYDTPILGYRANTVNLLRLWRAETADNLCKTLYPVDGDEQGRAVRLKQQFFLISCSLQDAIRLHLQAGHPLSHLPQRFNLQLNDTDSALAVAELLRLLVDEHGIAWEQAWEMTCQTLSYTNHSLMPETLDDLWSLGLLGSVLPRHLEMVLEINARFLEEVRLQYPEDGERVSRLSLINEVGDRYLRLTNLACVGSHAINGVSALHTALLEQKILSDFYTLYPDRFSNKTNGTSPRRFLLLTNPSLANLITSRIGDGWITNLDRLQHLAAAADDGNFRQEWQNVKQSAKQRLAEYIRQQTGVEVNTHSLFDVQVMVMHEYKRQHLNVLNILTLYNRIKQNPNTDITPRTFIFSGKAAPDYFTAKLIIKLIHAVAALVNSDADVGGRLRVVFLPDFTIKLAERIYPAIELSEHLSTAGTEASDTGNMIAALNGALIIGTPDGSNLEIRDVIGAENFFQFGRTAQEVEDLRSQGYNPYEIYSRHLELKGAIDLLTSGTLSEGDTGLFQPLVNLLLSNDYYLLLADYDSYISCQEGISQLYRDLTEWTRMSILSTSHMGAFSSDRAVQEYNQTIWQISPLTELQAYAGQNT